MKQAKGYIPPKHYGSRRKRVIQIGFDVDMFEDISKMATENNRTFAEQVRIFCEWGMEQSDA